jgi:hypothetical protein
MSGVGTLRRYVAVGTDNASYSEEAINCVWDGFTWTKDANNQQALLIRKGINGSTTLFRPASDNIAWADTAWNTQIYPNATPKAWAHLRRRWAAGNVNPTGQWMLHSGANIQSVSYVPYSSALLEETPTLTYSGSPSTLQYAQGRGIRLRFIQPLSSEDYAVFVTLYNPSSRVSRNFRSDGSTAAHKDVVLRQLYNLPTNTYTDFIDIFCRTFMRIDASSGGIIPVGGIPTPVVALRDICASGMVAGSFTEYQNGSGDSLDDASPSGGGTASEDILAQSQDMSLGLSVVIYAN